MDVLNASQDAHEVFINSYFVVCLVGEIKVSRIIHTWKKALSYIDYEVNSTNLVSCTHVLHPIHDRKNWELDKDGIPMLYADSEFETGGYLGLYVTRIIATNNKVLELCIS